MLKKFLKLLLVLIILLAIYIQTRPDDFRISRSTSISAAPAAVFAVVNDFHQWDAWSPWSKLDPAMKVSFEGPGSGVGAIYKWSGNNEVGEGQSTLVASQPNDRIGIQLDFVRPFAGRNDVEFTFKLQGDATLVTWTMSGKNNFISKAVGLFLNCEKMVGGQFDTGLAQLKALLEGHKS